MRKMTPSLRDDATPALSRPHKTAPLSLSSTHSPICSPNFYHPSLSL
jgi:hypothetical protein